jgi:putative ABC transport system permease protein
LRNIPRRRAQTILVIVGLMLSTVIITSAFSTGDTVSYSIRNATIKNLGFIDESVTSTGVGQNTAAAGGVAYIPPAVQQRILTTLAGNQNVDGYTSILARNAALQDTTSGQTKNQNVLAGLPANLPSTFGPLTTTAGAVVTIQDLEPNQVYLNQKAADDLNAHAGDSLLVYIGSQPVREQVKAIVRGENLASGGLLSNGQASDPTVLAPLDRVQTLSGQANGVTQILISNKGNDTSGESLSDGITNQLRALLANTTAVAKVQSLLNTPAGQAALTKVIKDETDSGIKTKLTALRTQAALSGQSTQLKSLLSDSDVSDALAGIKSSSVSAPMNDALASISLYHVEPLKKNGLNAADLFGSVFTSIFVVFGLFSIAAGIMLIFLIFVMLAAERRPEMGMARAVGTKRRHLIMQFLFEGYTYDLGSAVVGVILGVAVGLGMVRILTAVIGNAAPDFSLDGHVEPRSLVVSFCLGALVTFITVAFSSVRVSRLNVVAAIRDLPEQFGVKTNAGHAWQQTKAEFAAIGTNPWRIVWWVAPTMLLFRSPPIGIAVLVLRLFWYLRHLVLAFFSRGPLFLIFGVLLVILGLNTKQAAFFTLGGSLLLIGAAMLARWIMQSAHVPDPVRNRIGYSIAGVGLVIFWLLPFDFWNNFGVPNLNAGPEMFFLSGLMMVLGAVWTVMYNIDILLGGLLLVFGGVGHLAPMIKMAVSYPTQHKFRTGLTLAMFSLVIFTLMFMSVIVGSSSSSLVLPRDTGNYQIYGAVNPNNPISSAAAKVATDPNLKNITAVGGIAKVAVGLRQPGQDTQNWTDYMANVLDDNYLRTTQFTLHSRAKTYTSDAQVWQALRTQPGTAVVDGGIVADDSSTSTFGQFALTGVYYKDSTFSPVTIQVRDSRTGAIVPLKVIGVLDQRAEVLPDLTTGIYVGEPTLTAAGLPSVQPNFYVFRVAGGADVHTAALALGKAFLSNGLDVKESLKEFNSNEAVSTGLFDLLEGFMGLGLIVGIAALGVVATRAVVERRQEIGMMRAIGFQRAMVRTTFLLESSFVAILGTVLGVGLGLGLARNLVNAEAKNNNSIALHVPWPQIGLIVLIAYLASLLTTYLPAWQASRVYPAEALRYE